MKYAALRALLCFMVFSPFITFGATVGVGENYSLRRDQSISGNFYALGANTTVVGDVTGDIFAAGLTVYVGSNLATEDMLIVADTAHLVSAISEDLRIFARNAYIGSSIGGDAAVAGFSVEILPQSIIAGDLLVGAATVDVQGKVGGNVKIAGGRVFINESIGGNVTVTADSLTLGPNAVISGNLTYAASEPALIESGAVIVGGVEFNQIQTRTRAEKFLPTFWGTWIIIRFAVLLLFALAAHGILRNISYKFVATAVEKSGWNLLKGFLVLLAVPVAAVIGALTFIGIPFSLFALSLYGIVVILAAVYAPIILGSSLVMIARKTRTIVVSWKTIVLGVAFVTVIDFIPFIGNLIWYTALLIALGSIYQLIFDKFVEVR